MLQIKKQGNSIVVQGLNHYFYPYNGTLEVPCNSVITVVDEGDIVLFRSASNYDVLFSAKVDEITINGNQVTKENVGEVFGGLSNVSSGGGLTPDQEEKLNNSVQISDYNADKSAQTTIDEAQNTEINKLKGDIEGKQDIIQDLTAIREGANLGKTALQEESDPVWTAEKGNYYTKSEIDTSLASKADKTEIPTVPTNVSAFTNDAGYLTEHQSLDNYYTKTESDGIYATQVVVNEEIATRIREIRDVKDAIKTKADKSEIPTVPTNVSAFTNDAGYLTEHQSLDDYYTKTEVNTSLESKADKTEIPSLNGYATEQWVGEQGYLTEHQPLKTINGETIVGNGNIEISSGEETDPIWNAEKVNYYTKTEVNSSLEAKANKTEIPTVPTNVSAFTNDAGYLTEHQSLKTINGETIVGDGDITISGGEQISNVLILPQNVEFTYKDGNKYKVVIRDISYNSKGGLDFTISVRENGLAPTYRKIGLFEKGGGGGWANEHYDSSAYGYKISGRNSIPYYVYIFSDDDNPIDENRMYFKIETPLKSGTDIKTINGESILGSGDIVISGGGEETDPVWTAEKGNYYTKSEIDTSLASKADKTEIPTVPTNVSAFTNDAGYLTQHQSLKTINGQTIVGNGNIEITSGEETDPVWTAEKVNYYTKTEVNSSLESKADKTEIPSLDNYYTKSEIDGIVGNVNNALSEIING